MVKVTINDMANKIRGDKQFTEKIEKVFPSLDDPIPVVFVMNDEHSTDIEIHVSITQISMLQDIFKQLSKPAKSLIGKTHRGQVWIDINRIYLIEAFGNDVETKIDNQRIQLDKKLYEYENELEDDGFVRIGKSTLVNTAKIVSVASSYNGKLLLYLDDGTKVDVNRSYTRSFKQKLLEKGG